MFFKSVAGLDKYATASQYETFTTSRTVTHKYYQGGKYLPLGVWRTQGFDVERIERLTLKADIKEDRVLGKTYRVKIVETGTSDDRGLVILYAPDP